MTVKNKFEPIITKLRGLSSQPLFKSAPRIQIKQALLGAAAGVIVVIGVSTFMGSRSPHVETFDMDSESLELVQSHPDVPAQTSIDPALSFGKFVTNRVKLNDTQRKVLGDKNARATIVIYDIGLKQEDIKNVSTALPKSVTVALSAYTPAFNALSKPFTEDGRETWISLSTQTAAFDTDNGNLAISPIDNIETVMPMVLDQLKNRSYITGVMIPPQSMMLDSENLWSALVSELFADGYGVFDPTYDTPQASLYYYNESPAPYIKGDIVVDTNQSADNLKASLKSVRERILNDKNAIVTASIYTPASLDILAEWVNSLEAEGITIIPLSAQAKL